MIKRRQAEADVFQHFDEDAAQAEHDDGAEDRVAVHAHDALHALGRHGRDQHAVDAGSGAVRAYAVQDGGVAVAHGVFARQVELHAAHIAFVQDVGRHHFQDHGAGRAGSGGHGGVGVRGKRAVGHGQAGLAQDVHRLHFVVGVAQRRGACINRRHGG
ncbi:hypothetical protein D3C77_564950 [compost metagenome]